MRKSIAIIRGGRDDRYRSMQNGAKVILALEKYRDEIEIIDVILDEENNWFERGIPSDPHKVFSKVDFYIDFTNNLKEDYHELSKKLEVRSLYQDKYIDSLNRISLNRLLDQLDIKVPKYKIIRRSDNLELSLKDVWTNFQMPIVIKEVNHNFNNSSRLFFNFLEALREIRKILAKQDEVIIQEYVYGKYISIAVLPKYRDEDYYTPIAMESLNKNSEKKCLISHDCEKSSFIFNDHNLKKEIQDLAKNIQKAILSNQHSMIDLALVENKKTKAYTFKILDIHLKPNLFEDSRFDFILKNSGIDLGGFILDKIIN